MSIVDSRPMQVASGMGDDMIANAATSLSFRSDELNEQSAGLPGGSSPLTARHIADVIAEAASIGSACATLRTAGWRATIAGNRITINEAVFAQYVGVSAADMDGAIWMIYGSGDATPIWVTTGGRR